MHYGYTGIFTTHPGKRDELLAILLEAARQLEGDPGCIHYLVGTTDEPETIRVIETWTSKEAHDASLEPEEVRATIRKAMPLIASTSEQRETTILGGKGL